MAVYSFRDQCLSLLRMLGPVYKLLRSMYRLFRCGITEVFRWVIPRRCFWGLPRGLFSLLDQVCSNVVPGRVVYEGQEVPVFEPESLVKRCGLRQDEFQPWPAFTASVKNARLFGRNLVLLDDRKRACREFMFADHCPATDDSYQVPTFEKPVFLPGRWTTLVSRYDSGYWHFLMDALPRLHALPEFPDDTGILVRGPIAEWQWEVLRMLDVEDRVRPTTETHLIVEELCFSSHTAMTGAWNPFAVQYLRAALMTEAGVARCPLSVDKASLTIRQPVDSSTGSTNIFVKRGSGWTRGIRNQDEVIRFFEDRGWQILEPETCSVAEQIQLFSRADAVCAAHGSALTNLLWMSSGAQVIELLSDNFMLGAFEWLARCRDLKHRFLVFPGDHRLSFEVDIECLEKAVCECCGDRR